MDPTDLMSLVIRYLTVLADPDHRPPSPRCNYSSFNASLARFVDSSLVVDPILRIQVIGLHASLGFTNTGSLGRRLVHEWIRSHVNLMTQKPEDLAIVFECSQAVGYSHRFGLRRLERTLKPLGIAVEQKLQPILPELSGWLTESRLRHRPVRKYVHSLIQMSTPGRLGKDDIEKSFSVKCNKSDCRICTEFRQELEIARAFHFPQNFS